MPGIQIPTCMLDGNGLPTSEVGFISTLLLNSSLKDCQGSWARRWGTSPSTIYDILHLYNCTCAWEGNHSKCLGFKYAKIRIKNTFYKCELQKHLHVPWVGALNCPGRLGIAEHAINRTWAKIKLKHCCPRRYCFARKLLRIVTRPDRYPDTCSELWKLAEQTEIKTIQGGSSNHSL